MKSNYLLPHKFKKIGWLLLTVGLIAGVILFTNLLDNNNLKIPVLSIYNSNFLTDKVTFFKIIKNGILDEIIALIIIIGGLIVGFSKEKIEDEFSYSLRKESLVWAIIVNYIVLIFTIIFVYDMTFFNILIFNMFTPLLFFIFRFNFIKLKSNSDEE